jgi:hypothetical protein
MCMVKGVSVAIAIHDFLPKSLSVFQRLHTSGDTISFLLSESLFFGMLVRKTRLYLLNDYKRMNSYDSRDIEWNLYTMEKI